MAATLGLEYTRGMDFERFTLELLECESVCWFVASCVQYVVFLANFS